MKKTAITLILGLIVFLVFVPEAMAADQNRSEYCEAKLSNNNCMASKKARKWWPGVFVVETCDGETPVTVPSDWCTQDTNKPPVANASTSVTGNRLEVGQSANIKFTVVCGKNNTPVPDAVINLYHEAGLVGLGYGLNKQDGYTSKTGPKGIATLNFVMAKDKLPIGNFKWRVEFDTSLDQDAMDGERSGWTPWETRSFTVTLVKRDYNFNLSSCPASTQPPAVSSTADKVKKGCGGGAACIKAAEGCLKGIPPVLVNDKDISACVAFAQPPAESVPPVGKPETSPETEIITRQNKMIRTLASECMKLSPDEKAKACNTKIIECVKSESAHNALATDVEKGINVFETEWIKSCRAQGKEAADAVSGTGPGTKPGTEPGPGPGTGTVAGPRVEPEIELSIHGMAEGKHSLQGFEDLGWISVGSRIIKANGDCIDAQDNGAIELTLTKDGKNIPVNKTSVLEGNELGETHEFNRICWSYQAKLPEGVSRAGRYTLNAVYKGNKSYSPAEASTTVEFTDKELEVTKTVIKVGGVKKAAAEGVKKIAFSKLLGSSGAVAGAQAVNEGGRIKIVDDPASPDGTITLTPETSIGNGSCDAQNIPIVHFMINLVNKEGVVKEFYDNTSYPNCEQYNLSLSELGDLSEISSIMTTASLPEDSESSYASSQSDPVVLTVSNNVASPQPFVSLSSNPAPENITSSDRVTVTATTNKKVADPVFKVSHNGEQSDVAAEASSGDCRDGVTTCQYLVSIDRPEGDYTVTFTGDGASDSLSFSTASQPAGEIESVGLLVAGTEVPMDLDGGMLSLNLDGSGSNSFLLVVHYTNGTEVRKNLTINYDQPTTASPSPAAGTEEEGCGEPVLKYNQCIACRTFQPVYQDACGNYTTGDNQENENECTDWCADAEETEVEDTTDTTDPAGAAGRDCIYSDGGNCYDGTINAQSTCGGKTPSGVCINPSGGCQYGGNQVDCQTGAAI